MRGEPASGAGGASRTSRGRLEESAALLAPVALIVGLALAGGGFELGPRHVAGLVAWLVVVALLVLGAGSGTTPGRPLYLAGGLIFGLAMLSALSSFWSGSGELSVVEADRVLAYLGFFGAAFLIAQTDQRAQRFAEGLTIALTAVALLGLASRLLPDLMQVAEGPGSGPQLRYPLGYWNANGAMFSIGVAMLLWASRGALSTGLRWAASAALPATLLAIYFTFSRGALLALLVAAGVAIALSRDRLWLGATLAIGMLGALPAILAVQARQALTDNAALPQTAEQGQEALAFLLAGTGLAILLFAGLRLLERRGGHSVGRAVALSRNPRALRIAGGTLAALAIAAVVVIGGRAREEFSSPDIRVPDDPAAHFSDLSGAGRAEFWSVALDTFADNPAFGAGAGAYQFAWERRRSIEMSVQDAHSLYLEAFAELGTVGGLLVLALVAFLLWTAFSAWRAAAEPRRDRYAVLLAAMLAFAVGAVFDWFWEIAVLGAVFFAAAGVLVAARCRQVAPGPGEDGKKREDRRFRLSVAGLVAAWLSAVALIGPLLVERALDRSNADAAVGDLPAAVGHAETARSIEPWAASPYVQLGLLAEAAGEYETAAERFTQAIDREHRNWQLYYLRSRVEREAGDTAAAEADLQRARRLNPLEDCLREEASCE